MKTQIAGRTNDLFGGEIMTTKEVAKALGTRPAIITENAKKCLPNKKIENGKPTLWTEEEVTVLLDYMQKHQSNNAGTDLSVQTIGAQTSLTPALMIKQAMELMQKGYELELERIKAENARITQERDNLAVRLDEDSQWASVKRMEALNPTKQFSWRALKRYALENGFPLKEVFDANYGTVKAYPREVWEEVYGEQIDNAPWD